jgi:hypothetical protein
MPETGIQKLSKLLRERGWSERPSLAAAALLVRELADVDGTGQWAVKSSGKSEIVYRVMREDGSVEVWVTREADDARTIAEALNVFCPPMPGRAD